MSDADKRTRLNQISTDTKVVWKDKLTVNQYVGVSSNLPMSGSHVEPVSSPQVLRMAGNLVDQMDAPTSGDQAKKAEAADRMSDWGYPGI